MGKCDIDVTNGYEQIWSSRRSRGSKVVLPAVLLRTPRDRFLLEVQSRFIGSPIS